MKIKKYIFNIFLICCTAMFAGAFGAILPKLIKEIKITFIQQNYHEHIAGLPHKLTLYGTTTCPYCGKARKLLNSKGISFNDRVIDEPGNADALYKKLGEKYVPILVSETGLVVGFDEEKYDSLSRKAYQR